VIRAAIMGAMAILGTQIGRRGSGLNTLVFTAALMCFFDPYLLWDVGFQLSFAATLGLVVIGNPLLKSFTSWLEMRIPSEKTRKVAGPKGESCSSPWQPRLPPCLLWPGISTWYP